MYNFYVYSIHFIVESGLTSSASPMLVFYSILNGAILPLEIFSIDSMLKQVIQMKVDLRVLSGLKTLRSRFYFTFENENN